MLGAHSAFRVKLFSRWDLCCFLTVPDQINAQNEVGHIYSWCTSSMFLQLHKAWIQPDIFQLLIWFVYSFHIFAKHFDACKSYWIRFPEKYFFPFRSPIPSFYIKVYCIKSGSHLLRNHPFHCLFPWVNIFSHSERCELNTWNQIQAPQWVAWFSKMLSILLLPLTSIRPAGSQHF